MSETDVTPADAEQAPEPYDGPARVAIRYVSEEPGEISLPGYLNPLPSIVEPGDVFTVEGSLAGEVTIADRFELVGEATPELLVEIAPKSPNEGLLKAELGEKLGLSDADVEATLHVDLVELADEHDRLNPQPPGADDDYPEGSPNV